MYGCVVVCWMTVINDIHPDDDTSVNKHVFFVVSRNEVMIYCSRGLLRVFHALCWSSPQSGTTSGTALTVTILNFFLSLMTLLTYTLSTYDASENKGIFSRIQPAVTLNCQTSPSLRGGWQNVYQTRQPVGVDCHSFV